MGSDDVVLSVTSHFAVYHFLGLGVGLGLGLGVRVRVILMGIGEVYTRSDDVIVRSDDGLTLTSRDWRVTSSHDGINELDAMRLMLAQPSRVSFTLSAASVAASVAFGSL